MPKAWALGAGGCGGAAGGPRWGGNPTEAAEGGAGAAGENMAAVAAWGCWGGKEYGKEEGWGGTGAPAPGHAMPAAKDGGAWLCAITVTTCACQLHVTLRGVFCTPRTFNVKGFRHKFALSSFRVRFTPIACRSNGSRIRAPFVTAHGCGGASEWLEVVKRVGGLCVGVREWVFDAMCKLQPRVCVFFCWVLGFVAGQRTMLLEPSARMAVFDPVCVVCSTHR